MDWHTPTLGKPQGCGPCAMVLWGSQKLTDESVEVPKLVIFLIYCRPKGLPSARAGSTVQSRPSETLFHVDPPGPKPAGMPSPIAEAGCFRPRRALRGGWQKSRFQATRNHDPLYHAVTPLFRTAPKQLPHGPDSGASVSGPSTPPANTGRNPVDDVCRPPAPTGHPGGVGHDNDGCRRHWRRDSGSGPARLHRFQVQL